MQETTVLYVAIASALVVVLGVALGVRTVPQGQVWTLERFGAYTRLLHPGLNLMLPPDHPSVFMFAREGVVAGLLA